MALPYAKIILDRLRGKWRALLFLVVAAAWALLATVAHKEGRPKGLDARTLTLSYGMPKSEVRRRMGLPSEVAAGREFWREGSALATVEYSGDTVDYVHYDPDVRHPGGGSTLVFHGGIIPQSRWGSF